MRTPVVLLTGVDPEAMASSLLALQFDLPQAVCVRHHIDVERQVLERTVSDLTGLLEREEIELEHACVSCALREDVVPTLERLAQDGRWGAVVAHLPLGAEARQVCGTLASRPTLARRLKVSAVVAAVAGAELVDDLLGDALLAERGWHCSHDDERGVGEVACAMVEYADVVSVAGHATDPAVDLLRLLARPGATIVNGTEHLEAAAVRDLHRPARTHGWADPMRTIELSVATSSLAWQVELRSDRPFHPARLLDGLESLGGGRHRSRGCFWLPTRPDTVLEWDGAGGQLSIGAHDEWRRLPRRTHLTLTGVGVAPSHLRHAFEELLLDPADVTPAQGAWHVAEDGFEPWLGPIREAA